MRDHHATLASRSIPAWAGETACSSSPSYASRVYPRVGGGNGDDDMDTMAIGGLSPRGRGKLAVRWKRT